MDAGLLPVADRPIEGRRAGGRATVDSTLLRVPRDTFRRVLSEFPQAAVKVHSNASARTRAFLRQIDAIRARAFEA